MNKERVKHIELLKTVPLVESRAEKRKAEVGSVLIRENRE